MGMDQALQARMRQIPAIQELYRQLQWERPTVWQKEGLNQVLVEVREEVRNGQAVPVLDRLLERIRAAAQNLAAPSLRPVINATGVVIHTNLGRSPLSQEVMDRVRQVASGYSTLEYRLDQGVRGSRHDHVGALLQQLIGAEAAMVVNNNAAAVLLALSQLAKGYEVIVSRGQLVEIGGSFRIPEVMAASGAHLIEVGATNKTHLEDYRRAVSAETRAILKVHASNFRMVGFTEQPTTGDLVTLAHEQGLVMLEDLGSGVVDAFSLGGYVEPSVREVVAAGVDVVTFSGDKLLGGPQAGLIVGRRKWIDGMKKHPLARALRVDKMTLTALEAVIRLYLEGRQGELPLWQMLDANPLELRTRARRLAARLRRNLPELIEVVAEPGVSAVGGGSMPGTTLPTWVIALSGGGRPVHYLEAELRRGPMPVIARIHDDRLLFDLRTVLPHQESALRQAILAAVGAIHEKNERL